MGGEQIDWVGGVAPAAPLSGDERKRRGIKRAIESKPDLYHRACEIARELGRARGEITADDVMEELMRRRLSTNLGNAAGGLFRGANWEFTGRWRKSARPSNHGHQNRVWRFIP